MSLFPPNAAEIRMHDQHMHHLRAIGNDQQVAAWRAAQMARINGDAADRQAAYARDQAERLARDAQRTAEQLAREGSASNKVLATQLQSLAAAIETMIQQNGVVMERQAALLTATLRGATGGQKLPQTKPRYKTRNTSSEGGATVPSADDRAKLIESLVMSQLSTEERFRYGKMKQQLQDLDPVEQAADYAITSASLYNLRSEALQKAELEPSLATEISVFKDLTVNVDNLDQTSIYLSLMTDGERKQYKTLLAERATHGVSSEPNSEASRIRNELDKLEFSVLQRAMTPAEKSSWAEINSRLSQEYPAGIDSIGESLAAKVGAIFESRQLENSILVRAIKERPLASFVNTGEAEAHGTLQPRLGRGKEFEG